MGKVCSHHTSTYVVFLGAIMSEKLKDIRGYEGLYKISTTGDVYSLHKRGFCGLYKMKTEEDICGYYRVSLCKDGKHTRKRVSRLVAEAFIPNPENKEIVNHIDFDRKNNNVENLEWCTQKENVLHSTQEGRYNLNRARAVFCVTDAGEIIKYESLAEAKRRTGARNISRAAKKNGKKAGGYFWFYTEMEALSWQMKLQISNRKK